jgi:hypothetical protein
MHFHDWAARVELVPFPFVEKLEAVPFPFVLDHS